MEHPTYEQLLAHLEGASSIKSAKQVEEHLEHCPECAAEIAGWQRTIKKLETYEWPTAVEPGAGSSGTVLKWAAAAAVLMLTVGFGIGRLSQPSAARLKQAVAAEVRQQVRNELKTDLLAAVAGRDPVGVDDFQQQLRRELISSLNAMQTSSLNPALLQDIIKPLQQKQDENQRMLLSLLYQVRQQHEADYLSLRHDLETAASVADDDLQQNRQQLSQLAATLFAKSQD